jgi:hypothetical protein
MSKKIEIPKHVIENVKSLLDVMEFKGLLDMFLKGMCRHTVIETGGKFEIVALSINCVGDRLFEFNFGITHECEDDRSWWVLDSAITVTRTSKQ